MIRNGIRKLFSALLVLMPLIVFGADSDNKSEQKEAEAKMISGMSIVGNNEVPKALYIVPWKSSEIGVETSLASGLLNDLMAPVDKDVFKRELEFYKLTQSN